MRLIFSILVLIFNFTIYGQIQELISLSNNFNALEKLNTILIDNNNQEYKYKTFSDWFIACKKLPFFNKAGTLFSNLNNKPHTTLDKQEIKLVINNFIKQAKDGHLSNSNNWLYPESAPKLTDTFFTSIVPINPIKPFVQKLIVQPETIIAFHGDIHGDIHSLIEYIANLQRKKYLDQKDGFNIIDKDKFHFIFLGDYEDRGNYGTEVIYTLMRLKIANPNNVHLIRGNHEDISITAKYGFTHEFMLKFKSQKLLNRLSRIYDLLPVAIYLGCGTANSKNFILCCHGGLEIGFDPSKLITSSDNIYYQWLDKLNQKEAAHKLKIDMISKAIYNIFEDFAPRSFNTIGFMWNDFIVQPYIDIEYTPGRGFAFGRGLTSKILKLYSTKTNKVKGVFRAHQHSGEMMNLILKNPANIANEGLAKIWQNNTNINLNLWDGIVCTFLVSPDSVYSTAYNYKYDAFGLLKTATEFKDWYLELFKNKIIK